VILPGCGEIDKEEDAHAASAFSSLAKRCSIFAPEIRLKYRLPHTN
jgi:hypothetical protein